MSRRLEILLVLLLSLLACDDERETVVTAHVTGDEKRGRELVNELECARCHAPSRKPSMSDCAGCHGAIRMAAEHGDYQNMAVGANSDRVRMWNRNILHFREPPTFVGITRLYRSEWLEYFLQKPHDLRPRLGETMPHLGVDAEQARDIVAYLRALDMHGAPQRALIHDARIADWQSETDALPAGDSTRGRAVFVEKGCDSCHVYGGVMKSLRRVVNDELEPRSMELAPDLRHARDRFLPGQLVGWLLEPRHYKHDAAMPDHDLGFQEARDLAAFVMTAPFDPALAPPKVKRPAQLALLDREVTYDEIYLEVFGKICVHCHSDPSAELGDGGPGFAGGFGFSARKLDLSDYESTFAGFVADDGKRHSVFEETNGVPRIVAAMWARWDELETGEIGEVRGMPLALPPLSAEQIRLVESWIAQGRKR